MDSAARHCLFTIGMIAIEQNDTLTATVVHRLLGDPLPNQPRFLDTDVSGLFHEVPATSEVPPAFEVPSVSSDSSQPESYQPEAQSDSSVSVCGDTRLWKRMGKKKSERKVYKDSYSLESRIET